MSDSNSSAAIEQNGLLPAVSLRDYFAGLAMQSYAGIWNGEISNKHRKQLLRDIVSRYGGEIMVNDAMALMAYELADSMIKARNGR